MATTAMYIKPELDSSIEFWGADSRLTKVSDAIKLKLVDVHPTRPLILTADRDGKICLWDYNLKLALLNCPVSSLLLENQVQSKNVVVKDHGFLQRISSRSNIPKQEHGTSERNTNSGMHLNTSISYASVGITSVPNASLAILSKLKQQVGQILQICFADSASILSNIGLSGYNACDFINSSNSDNIIVVVCEHIAIFHDYYSSETTVLPPNLWKSSITSVEPIYLNTFAVGCSDGLIRIWDTSANSANGGNSNYRYSFTSGTGISNTSSILSSNGGGGGGNSNNGNLLAIATPLKGSLRGCLQTYHKSDIIAIKSLPIRR